MRYFIGFLVTIGLLILLVVLLLTGGHGGNGGQKIPTTGEKPKTTSELAAYADTGAAVRLIIDGPINADEIHTAVRITVDQQDVTYEQIQGYQGTVVNTQVYASNQSAYSNFLYALGHGGFTLGDDNPKLTNEKGYCPLGQRFVFELRDGDHDIERYWATSCGHSAPKTYKGSLQLTLSLFQAQVPDYTDLTQNLENLR
ncbi:MAG TPA: hypothetical protein VFH99_03825 [Candidatus Saccharimonadales bacterium]|nr:hypothetical protein [Candidatus Saccharimonadales bacterium]